MVVKISILLVQYSYIKVSGIKTGILEGSPHSKVQRTTFVNGLGAKTKEAKNHAHVNFFRARFGIITQLRPPKASCYKIDNFPAKCTNHLLPNYYTY